MKNLHGFFTMWTYSRRLVTSQWLLLTRRPITNVQSSNCVQNKQFSSNPGLRRLNKCSDTASRLLIRSYSTRIDSALSQSQNTNPPALVQPEPELLVLDEDDEDLEPIDKILEQKRRIWAGQPSDVYTLPSYNLAAYANDSKVLKKFMQLGVQIHAWDRKEGIPSFILKLDFDKDIAPIIRFLVDHGLEADRLGDYFTRNPHIFKEDVQNLEIRLNYLRSKKFSKENITRIIDRNPYWLLFDTTRIDRRLGFYQTYFNLTGEQVRTLAVVGPKMITYNLAHVKDVTFTVKDEMGFEPKEVTQLLLEHPGIWKIHPKALWARFDYLHNVIKFSHEHLLKSPRLLKTRLSRLRHRIGFLQSIARAQFDPAKPNYVSMDALVSGEDAQFAGTVAKSTVYEYNKYLKTL